MAVGQKLRRGVENYVLASNSVLYNPIETRIFTEICPQQKLVYHPHLRILVTENLWGYIFVEDLGKIRLLEEFLAENILYHY